MSCLCVYWVCTARLWEQEKLLEAPPRKEQQRERVMHWLQPPFPGPLCHWGRGGRQKKYLYWRLSDTKTFRWNGGIQSRVHEQLWACESKRSRIMAKRKEKKIPWALISLNEKPFTVFHFWSISFHSYSNGNYCSSLLTKKSFDSFHMIPYFKYLTTYWFDSLAAFLIEELEFDFF